MEISQESGLAVGAVDAGPLPEGDEAQLGAALPAGLAVTAVDVEALLEVARLAGTADEVAQGGAALGDGRGQHLPGGGGQAVVALAADATGGTARVDARHEERLRSEERR